MSDIIKPSEFTEPSDLVNLGLKCRCGSRNVIYHISVPAVHFPVGDYCYQCLLNNCRLASRIPVPIEWNLQARLEADLGIVNTRKYYLGAQPLTR